MDLLLLALEWIGSLGVIASILLYPRTVPGAAIVALVANALLFIVLSHNMLWGTVVLCVAGFISHGYNLWRYRNAKASKEDS